MSSIEERVKKIVAEQLGVKEEEVQTEASFVEKITTVALAIAYINSNLA
jgi:acyl carrier protein